MIRQTVVRVLMLAVLAWCGMGVLASTAQARPASPDDLDWLRKLCGDGALGYEDVGRIYITELLTGRTVLVGNGSKPKFSPDSSKLAWVDGDRAVARMRQGDGAVYVLAEKIDGVGGIHWLSDEEILFYGGDRKWYRMQLDGSDRREVPELTSMGRPGREIDVKLGSDGVWSMVSARVWRTSDGRRGDVAGRCSVSLSPDGRSVTSLMPGHTELRIQPVRPGGINRKVRWPYRSEGRYGFDNHRWSSNDPRFIVVVDEVHLIPVVMLADMSRGTRMGEHCSRNDMYGDFTVGDPSGKPFPQGLKVHQPGRGQVAAKVNAPDGWPQKSEGLVWVWHQAHQSNSVSMPDAEVPTLCRLQRKGLARFGRHQDLLPAGGSFHAETQPIAAAVAAVGRSDELTFEALWTPGDRTMRDAAAAITLTDARGGALVQMRQQGSDLQAVVMMPGRRGVATPRDTDWRSLMAIDDDKPRHLTLRIANESRNRLRVMTFIDGRQAAVWYLDGRLSNWQGGELILGEAERGRWSGRMEHIALYARALDDAQILAHAAYHQQQLARRQAPQRITVQAQLKSVSSVPDAGNYPDALVVYLYDVQQVTQGQLRERQVRIAHWGVVNGMPQQPIARRSPGSVHRITLEPFDAHPQLASIKLSDDTPDDTQALPLWVEETGE